ncbi:pitrilysin family protein [Parvularcula sp. IMCC14364]|uniref:M16 family metallopeptidase n=1 Tax=Parvularcula sp. IMCC14364 TaxID=3067902 RepID=UPI002740A372|nr:pitrilysin family protein [Parvularcula sp. IMCC14364]
MTRFSETLRSRSSLLAISLAALSLAACGNSPSADNYQEPATPEMTDTSSQLSVAVEKYELENGLDVVLHVDKSDPVVAINLAVHVGSARELPGRTGFAHLFEHLLFLDSENLGYGGLDEMNTRIGGEGTNGFTTNDMTQYFQAVPADALEKIIWAEADKLGYFINTVTEDVIINEKQVVKNEKRQRVDNQPYGHNFYVIGKAMYPEDHPYNWQVIGSLADLEAASLEDVQAFYRRWYVPNNVTVTISGDFDPAEAKRLVEKYFAEIPRGEEIERQEPRAAQLDENISLYHEDSFATVPLLTMVWPGVEQFHPDSYPLEILVAYLSEGKRAPLNEVLIDEEKLTSDVSMFNSTSELAGELYLFINSNAGEDLDGLVPALQQGLARFEENGISQEDLDRIKAGLEVDFYDNIQSALGKAIQLGEYNLFTGDPGYINEDISQMLGVTTEDVMRVYNTYIKDKPFVATSFVPEGKLKLALEGATQAEVVEEKIVQGAETVAEFDPTIRNFTPTPSSFDRTVEPPFGEPYDLSSPEVWRDTLGNGIDVYGIENTETPLVYFSLAIGAGRERGDPAKPAVANMTADMLEKGTAGKTTAELEDAINMLGSSIRINEGSYGTFVQGETLARNFDETISLVQEMLLEPRWDEEEFELLKRQRINELEQAAGSPNAIAARESAQLLYPDDHMFSYRPYGTIEKLEKVSLEDLKAFYAANYTPADARLQVVGDVTSADVSSAFDGLATRWTKQGPAAVSLPLAAEITESQIFFYDIPGAKQSVIIAARPSLAATDDDYPLAEAMNFLLGGIYTSELNTELRVNRGYTYGIRSGFSGAEDRGTFAVQTSVRSNVTKESIELIRDILASYGPEFTENDLEIMKGALLRGLALETETLGDKLGLLDDISTYGYPEDYLARNAERVDAMTLDDFKSLAQNYLRPDAMNWLVVGDAQTQAPRMEDVGFGAPVMLETDQ